MNTDIFLQCRGADTDSVVLSDAALARCPDILAFHAALNRVFRKHYEFSGELHPFYELVFVVEGCVGITAGEAIYTLNKGQMLLHYPEEFHRIWSENDSEPHVINLSFYASAMPACEGRILEPSDAEAQELTRICDSVCRALQESDRQCLNEERLRLELFLLRVMGRGSTDVSPSESESALRYAAIVNLLREHLEEPLTAQEIAEMCGMSLSSLKKIFSRYAGMGVVSYFTEMKMRQAVSLLRAGKRVGETAYALGYSDQNYFSTVFHRVMGAPPGAYRNAVEPEPIQRKQNFYIKEGTTMKFITVDTYEKLSRQAANLIIAQITMKPNSVLGLATG